MKKTLACLLLIATFFMGCQNEKNKLANEISQLEKNLETETELETANQLAELYKKHVNDFPEDSINNPKYLYRLAGLFYRMNKSTSSIEELRTILKNYPNAADLYNISSLLATIYDENFNEKDIAYTIYQALIERGITPEQEAIVTKKIQSAMPPAEDRLRVLQAYIFNDSTKRVDYKYANEFILCSEYFGLIQPNKPSSPEILMRAAETARTIRSFPKALEIYELVYDRYPNHPKAPQALFLRAFTLDNDVKDFENARLLYNQFLEKYPNDEFADDASFLLKNLGKDDEEIINSFQQQENQEESN